MEEDSNRKGEVSHLLMHNFFRNYFHFLSVQKKLKSLKNRKSIDRWTDERDMQLFSTIISATLLIEAFMNEYGAVKLEKTFDNYLERIDLLSKCVLIPKLADNINLENNPSLLSRLKKLIAVRNKLVHPKLFEVPLDYKLSEKKFQTVKEQWNQMAFVAKDSLQLLHDFGKYLNHNHHENSYSMAAGLEGACKRQLNEGKFIPVISY